MIISPYGAGIWIAKWAHGSNATPNIRSAQSVRRLVRRSTTIESSSGVDTTGDRRAITGPVAYAQFPARGAGATPGVVVATVTPGVVPPVSELVAVICETFPSVAGNVTVYGPPFEPVAVTPV